MFYSLFKYNLKYEIVKLTCRYMFSLFHTFIRENNIFFKSIPSISSTLHHQGSVGHQQRGRRLPGAQGCGSGSGGRLLRQLHLPGVGRMCIRWSILPNPVSCLPPTGIPARCATTWRWLPRRSARTSPI